MSKFQYVLGWLSVILSVAVVVGIVVVGIVEKSWVLLPRLIWMAFVFPWGVRRIKAYKAKKILDEYGIEEVSK